MTGRSDMELVVNGKSMRCAKGMTLLGLLGELGLAPEAIVVERNAEFVQRSQYGDTALSDGDTLELIQFVGGG